MTVTPGWYMALAAVLFVIGAGGMLLRRNALVMFMAVELMLNAVNLTFVAAGRELGMVEGQLAVLFVMVVAAAEVGGGAGCGGGGGGAADFCAGPGEPVLVRWFDWFPAFGVVAELRWDPLSALMTLVGTGGGAVVHPYS